jgi:hypothetical protein
MAAKESIGEVRARMVVLAVTVKARSLNLCEEIQDSPMSAIIFGRSLNEMAGMYALLSGSTLQRDLHLQVAARMHVLWIVHSWWESLVGSSFDRHALLKGRWFEAASVAK